MSSRALTRLLLKGPRCGRRFSLHTLPEQHRALQKLARDFAVSELRPIAAKLDKEHRFPAEQIRELGRLGLLAISVPSEWGGAGFDTLGIAVAVEEISKGCGGTGAVVSIHNCLYASLLQSCGTDVQKERFLRPFTGGTIGCFCLSEPDAGSDVVSMTTTATLDGDHYVLNGIKSWVTSGPIGKAAVIFATVDKSLKHKGITAFLVPIPTEGLTIGKTDDKLGIRAAPSCNFMLDNVRVPKENVLGQVGEGFKIAMVQLDKARVGIAAQAIGIGQAAMDVAMDYAAQRKAFGAAINQLQAVKLRIADMALHLESARLLLYRAAVMVDSSERPTKACSMAKLAASKAATHCAHNAMQILGGVGYVTAMPAERHYRDARITQIYGGVTDIQKLLIGDTVIKEYE